MCNLQPDKTNRSCQTDSVEYVVQLREETGKVSRYAVIKHQYNVKGEGHML